VILGSWAAEDSWGQSLFFFIAAALLAAALVFASAPGHPITIGLITAALVAALFGFVAPRMPWMLRVGERTVARAGVIALAVQFGLLLAIPPHFFLALDPSTNEIPYLVGGGMAAVIAMWLVGRTSHRGQFAGLCALLVIHLLMGIWVIHASPAPNSDVWIFQQQGSQALLHGVDPYAITTFPDLYGPGSPYYAPGLVENGHLTFGFIYPPLSLLMALPGYVVGGDHRYAQLVAMSAATLLIAYIRPGRVALIAALLLLFTPRVFLVLDQGWTDPFVVLLLAATVFLAVRSHSFTSIALGLLIAVKQTMVLALPLGALLLRSIRVRDWRGISWQAAAVAAVVSLPLILWNVDAFLWSAVELHITQPFRADSMSYVAWLGHNGQPGLPLWLGFAMLVPAGALVLWRAARTPAGFAASTAIVLLVFFVFSKQAFVHYFYLVIGCLCCAIAAMQPTAVRSEERTR
jgi:4-amino-4-deoxy-L-arabinose transferase-like glycosyltransferase